MLAGIVNACASDRRRSDVASNTSREQGDMVYAGSMKSRRKDSNHKRRYKHHITAIYTIKSQRSNHHVRQDNPFVLGGDWQHARRTRQTRYQRHKPRP